MRVCTLASGSSGNSIYIEGEETRLLIDAGLSGKDIAAKLGSHHIDPASLDAILVTHEHIDHIKGVGVMARKHDLKVYASELTWLEMEGKIGEIPDYNRCVLETGAALELGGIKVESFDISHDAADPVGFCLFEGGNQIGVATDTGCLTRSARKYIDGSDFLIFEANHDLEMLKQGRYPWNLKKRILSDRGHLSNTAAGYCLASLIVGRTQGVILAHLSGENNIPDLAYSTVAKILSDAGLFPGKDFALEVAPRSNPGKMWEFE